MYLYAMINRPAWQAAPPGYKEVNYNTSDFRHGVVEYDHKLTAEELAQYEMTPLSPDAQPFAIGDTVLVNDIDTGAVIDYTFNGIQTSIMVVGEFGGHGWITCEPAKNIRLIKKFSRRPADIVFGTEADTPIRLDSNRHDKADNCVEFHFSRMSTHWTIDEISEDPMFFLKCLHEAVGDHDIRQQEREPDE